MPQTIYECMFLLDTTKVAGDVPNAEKALHAIFARNHAEVLISRPWDERRLAYPINGQKKGLYFLTYFQSETKSIVGIERDCAINEMILRMSIIKIDPKLVETMLAVAKGEHAVALHNIHDEGGDDGLGGDEPPRRRRERAEKD